MGLDCSENHYTSEINRARARVYRAEDKLKEAEAALKRAIDDLLGKQQYAAQSQ